LPREQARATRAAATATPQRQAGTCARMREPLEGRPRADDSSGTWAHPAAISRGLAPLAARSRTRGRPPPRPMGDPSLERALRGHGSGPTPRANRTPFTRSESPSGGSHGAPTVAAEVHAL